MSESKMSESNQSMTLIEGKPANAVIAQAIKKERIRLPGVYYAIARRKDISKKVKKDLLANIRKIMTDKFYAQSVLSGIHNPGYDVQRFFNQPHHRQLDQLCLWRLTGLQLAYENTYHLMAAKARQL